MKSTINFYFLVPKGISLRWWWYPFQKKDINPLAKNTEVEISIIKSDSINGYYTFVIYAKPKDDKNDSSFIFINDLNMAILLPLLPNK